MLENKVNVLDEHKACTLNTIEREYGLSLDILEDLYLNNFYGTTFGELRFMLSDNGNGKNPFLIVRKNLISAPVQPGETSVRYSFIQLDNGVWTYEKETFTTK